MKISKLAIKSVFVAAVLALTACASMGDGTVAEKRQAILDMQDNLVIISNTKEIVKVKRGVNNFFNIVKNEKFKRLLYKIKVEVKK